MLKHILYISSLLCLGLEGLQAQTEVKRYDATAESGYGVVYTLPKTEIAIEIDLAETEYVPGTLAPYAEKYLGRSVELQGYKHYDIAQVRLRSVGVPDSTKQYVVLFDKKSVAPFVKLTPQGILYSINGNQAPAVEPTTLRPASTLSTAGKVAPFLPREYATATHPAKRAEIAAAHLYELREHSMAIVTGEVEQMPKDGEAMRIALGQIKAQEQAVQALFTGDTIRRSFTEQYRIQPTAEDISGQTLCHFSPDYGIVAGDDPTGDAITLQLRIVERATELSDKEQKAKEKIEGIIYNLPGTAEVSISYRGKQLALKRIPLTQVGTTQALARRMFNIKESGTTAVYFDIHSGALIEVKQE